jgi:hypothetical protein
LKMANQGDIQFFDELMASLQRTNSGTTPTPISKTETFTLAD